MGKRGRKPQDYCQRGHELADWSTLPATRSGRRCRACARAISTAWNLEHRKGIVLTPQEFADLADEKFSLLAAEMGRPINVWA